MTVPSKADFDDWLEGATAEHEYAEDVFGLLTQVESLTREDVVEHLSMLDAERDAMRARLGEMPAWKWIAKQREFQRAHHLLWYGRRARKSGGQSGPARNDVICARVEQLFRAAMDTSRPLRHSRKTPRETVSPDIALRELLTPWRRSYTFRDHWTTSCLAALRQYHHSEDWKSSILVAKSWTAKRESAVRALRELTGILAHVDSLGLKSGGTQRFRFALDSANALPLRIEVPVKRNDLHAREQLFVFQLFRANRSAVRKPKAEVIVDLMGLEGFEHQYPLRHVERLCASFADKFFPKRTA